MREEPECPIPLPPFVPKTAEEQERERARLARFAKGCEVCDAMDWYAGTTRTPDGGCTFVCGSCGNVFDVPLVEEDSTPGDANGQ